MDRVEVAPSRTPFLDKKTLMALMPLLGRYGARTAVVLARGYLGPVARVVEERCCEEQRKPKRPCGPEPANPDRPATHGEGTSDLPPVERSTNAVAPEPPRTKPFGLEPCDVAILGMAVTKLVYEAGELALHNPGVTSAGKHPEFKLDEHGSPPAISLSHVVAATRLWRDRGVEPDSADGTAAESQRAPTPTPATPRARLQALRAERYAGSNRYGYVPASSTQRAPR
jgi:hypothetical protein